MTILIDNYDSFSYNLYQLAGTLDPDIRVIRNDALTVEEVAALRPDHLILSPGPGRPEDAGITMEAAKTLGPHNPHAGGLPGAPGHRGRLWGHRYLCSPADARQAVAHYAGHKLPTVSRLPRQGSGGPLSFAGH